MEGDSRLHLTLVQAEAEKRTDNEFVSTWLFGKEIASASFGPAATKQVEVHVPSSDGSGHSIPVTCACPSTATAGDTLPLVLYFHSGKRFVRFCDSRAFDALCLTTN